MLLSRKKENCYKIKPQNDLLLVNNQYYTFQDGEWYPITLDRAISHVLNRLKLVNPSTTRREAAIQVSELKPGSIKEMFRNGELKIAAKGYMGEETCRQVLQDIFKDKFPKARPGFLQGLELDCYNERLKIAVEYNGPQHYEFTAKFHKTSQDLIDQQLRDSKKRELCEKHGIRLISVSFVLTDYVEIKNFILQNL